MRVPRLLIWAALPVLAQRPPVHPDSAAVAQRLRVASFGGTGNTSIVAMATDSAGNIYVTGTTSAPDFPVKNAAQPAMGEAQVLRTTDLGATWSRVNVPADVSSVVPDPVDPQVVFGLAGPMTYKSSDGGGTWRTVLNFGTPSWQMGSLAIDPGNHLRIAALGPDGALHVSTDGGATWSRGGACPVYYCSGTLLADPTGSGTLLVESLQPYISRDWGVTFQRMQIPGALSPAAFDPSHKGWIYAGTMMGVSGSVYLSTDFGATWTAKGSPPSIFSAMNGLAVDPNQPNTLVGSTADALYRSTDEGTSWVQASGPGASPLVDTHGPLFYVGKGCDGLVSRVSGPGYYGIGFSKDQGAHWTGPALSQVTGAAPGAGCAVYVTRTVTTDAFVAKLAQDGTIIWATYLGGADADAPIGIAVDGAGSVSVLGNTSSLDFPVTAARLGPPA